MTHCVYRAYTDLLLHHGIEIGARESSMYNWIRNFTGHSKSNPVKGAIVPYLMYMMMSVRGYRPIVAALPGFRGDMYLDLYDNPIIQMMIRSSDFGDTELHTGPAIYLMLAKQHAAFLEERPESGKPIMSITMEKYNYDKTNQYYVSS